MGRPPVWARLEMLRQRLLISKMENGYIKLQRKFFSHWLWEEARSFSKAEAFLDLLQLAAFAPTKRMIQGKLFRLEQGELIASTRYLAARWDWGKDRVAGFMRLLESDSMIRRETRQGQTVLTVCNYERYAQSNSTQSDSNRDAHRDRGPTEARQRPDKVEEGKEGKEGKEGVLVDLAEPKPTRSPPPYKQIVDAYNATLGGELPVCRIRNASREAAIRRMWRYLDCDMGKVQAYFRKVRESDFLCGRGKNKKNFCSFDWLLKQANITKTLEGNYDNE